MSQTSPRTKLLFALALGALVFLHQDFWNWDDSSLWLGFLPAGLAYHALYSLGMGVFWALVVRLGWPVEQAEADNPPGEGSAT